MTQNYIPIISKRKDISKHIQEIEIGNFAVIKGTMGIITDFGFQNMTGPMNLLKTKRVVMKDERIYIESRTYEVQRNNELILRRYQGSTLKSSEDKNLVRKFDRRGFTRQSI